jgi:hypothetical protein
MLWEDGIAYIQGLPLYLHHVITRTYEDGVTFEIKVYFTDGSTKTFMAYTQPTAAGREIVKYKLLTV